MLVDFIFMKIILDNVELENLINSRVNLQRKFEESLKKEKALQAVMQKILRKIESDKTSDLILSEIKQMIDGVKEIPF